VVEELSERRHVLSCPISLGHCLTFRQSTSSAVRAGETPAKRRNARLEGVSDLFDGKREQVRCLTEATFDEMVGRDGSARMPYSGVASSLSQMRPDDVSAQATRLAAELNGCGEVTVHPR
jgi:hypothetical protein